MSLFTDRINMACELVTLPEEIKYNILVKLGILGDEIIKGKESSLITDNIECYNAICNWDVMYMLMLDKKESYFIKAALEYPKIRTMLTSYSNINETLAKLDGIVVTKPGIVNRESIENGLRSFGLKVTEAIEDGDIIGGDESILLGNEDIPEVNFDDNELEKAIESQVEDFDDPEDPEDDFEEDPEEPEIYDESESRDAGDNKEIDPLDIEDDPEPEPTEDDKKFRAVWGSKAGVIVNTVMKAYDKLYKSGYGIVQPEGVLTNVGVLKSVSSTRKSGNGRDELTPGGNMVMDMELYSAIVDTLGESCTFRYYAYGDPDIEELMDKSEPVTYINWHVKNTFGHFGYCGASLRNYIKDKYKNRSDDEAKLLSKSKITRYDDIRGWILKQIENCIYDSYKKCGLTSSVKPDDVEKANMINEKILASLKNVIIVAERKENVNTRIRICSNSPLSADGLIRGLSNKLNTGTSSTIKVRQIGEYSEGVLELDIIYNEKIHSQDSLFAYEVLKDLKEQGIRPSWDNVILGKKDDGTIMTYNFKNKKSPTYALYAASRSGKGVMTLNLIASALADGCKLMYIDGKPDMACVLGDVAWGQGLDACVFNGVAGKGSETLEGRPGCIRDSKAPFASKDKLLKEIFLTTEERNKFMLIATYLRGINLLCDTAAYRASMADSLKKNDWLVAVFDECEQAAIAETDIMELLDRAEAGRKAAKDENGKKINLVSDPAYVFIQNFRKWTSIITSKFKTCVTSTFGYANMTTFFVWQSTKFPEKYKSTSSIAKVVDGAAGNIVKIVGRGAAVNYGSTAFGTPSSLSKCTWYDKRFSGDNGGFFAIGGDVNTDGMKVFRPFNVYSDAKHKDLILENAATMGLTEQDLIGSQLNPDGTVVNEVGFEGYVNKMLSEYGLNAAQQLNIGFKYAEQISQKINGCSLLEYMYNCHDFGARDVDMSEVGGLDPETTGGSPVEPQRITEGFDTSRLGTNPEDDREIAGQQWGDDGNNTREQAQEPVKSPQRSQQAQEMSAAGFAGMDRYADIFRTVGNNGMPNPMGNKAGAGFDMGDDDDEDEIAYGTEDAYSQEEYSEEYEVPVESDSGEIDYRKIFGEAFFRPEEAPINNTRVSETFGKNQREYKLYPNEVSHAWDLTDDNCINVYMPSYDTAESFNDRFFRKVSGAKWEFDRRWKIIIKSINSRLKSKDLVTRITIYEDEMRINGKFIALHGVVGGFEDIEFKDIVNFAMLAKEYKNIKKLLLDNTIMSQAMHESPDADAVKYLFNLMPNLQELVLRGYGKDFVTTRAEFNSNIINEQAKAVVEQEKYRQQFMAMAAGQDPNLKDRSPGEQRRILTSTKAYPKEVMQKARSQFQRSSGSFLKGTALGVGDMVAIGIGGIAGTIYRAGHWLFGKR